MARNRLKQALKPGHGPEMIPFVTRIISTHRKQYWGKKRIMAIVNCLGVNKTVHLDVPADFSI